MSQGQLKSDGTTSTNYGPPFEISSVAIFILRCLKQRKEFQAWINYTEYEPWDDIVGILEEGTLCVQLKHNEKLDRDKLRICLEKRESLLTKHQSKPLTFVYFATTPDSSIRNDYSKSETYPKILDLLLTNKNSVYLDENGKSNTYLCTSQNTVACEGTDVKQALSDCIGQHYVTEEHLKEIQTKFMDYISKRYLRLLKGSDPLTNEEIRQQLAYTILNKFKVEYNPNQAKPNVSNDFEDVLGSSSVVVFNHRWSSAFKEQIWSHLLSYLEKHISKKHLKSSNLNELWIEEKIHMPLVSPNRESDKVILRALEIGGFKPKVIILRPRTFTIKNGQDIITILQNLNENNDKMLVMKTKEDVENFKFCRVNLPTIIKNRNLKLHQDSFTEISRNYFKKSTNGILGSYIEAHDEFNYVNDFNSFNDKFVPALFPTIKVKDISINIIQQLINLGSNVNASIDGIRPIFYAIEENRSDIVELLLKNNADNDPADKDGIRPLFIACIENKIEIARLLIDYGADRNTADFYGVRPLFMAYNNGNYEILKLLLKDFEFAAAANTAGSHILHIIAEDGSIEGLECILKYGPNINVFMTGDVKGKTPLDLAADKGHEKFVQKLKEALNVA